VTYAEELRTSYIEVHKRLWGNAIPAVTVNCEPQLKTSGNATGAMWQGLAPKVPFEPGSRKAVEIIAAVLQVTEICRRDFMSNRRTRNFVEARQLAYWFLRHHTKLSTPQIGQMIGDRDHSTVLHGIRKVSTHPRKFGDRLTKIALALRLELPPEVPFQ
jgi:hypothetical protein